jgi:hypothetical protein
MALSTFLHSIALVATQFGIVLAPILTYGACRPSKKIFVATLLTLILGFLQAASVDLDLLGWINLAIFSLAMCWLRYPSGSVWPAIIAHNANNGLYQLIALTTHS